MRPSRKQLAEAFGKYAMGVRPGHDEWTERDDKALHYSRRVAAFSQDVTPRVVEEALKEFFRGAIK
jgi:hypothetical protein